MEQIAFNKTKIVATVGPACNTKEKLRDLIIAGTDVFRLNFSHGDHEIHGTVIKYIRDLNQELGTNVAILQDLQGPKIRTREVQEGLVLKAGDQLVITTEKILGTKDRISTTYSALPKDVQAGEVILIDDGKISLMIKEVNGDEVLTQVMHGGPLKSRKGMNLPKSHLSAPSLTKKDKRDLEFGIENEVDWVALSFVRAARDINSLRRIIAKRGGSAKIIAKIERPEALDHLDDIIDATDGVMVARGDLGVEIDMEAVPMVQKTIVDKCNKKAKPVIIATQMMESMIENPRPTRAETNDVANAVMDGADALMLSAETAAGSYPIEAIRSMVKTITFVEKDDSIYNNFYQLGREEDLFIHNTLVYTACKLADFSQANGILGITQSGYLALRLSSHRPKSTLYIFTGNRKILNTMNLIWGVRAFFYNEEKGTDETFEDLEAILRKKGFLKSGDVLVNTASMPLAKKQRTNTIRIDRVS